MQINGQTMIFKNDKGNYSTGISQKKEDGTYTSMYIPVNFKKGVEVSNKSKINIKNGFLSFYTTQKGENVLKIVITEFEEENNEISKDDLPF